MGKRVLLGAGAIVCLLAVALAVFFATRDGTVPSDGRLKVRLTAFQLYISAMVVAAEQSAEIVPGKDCFAEAGLAPTIIKRSKGPEIVDALVGGSADFGTLALTPQVFQALQGSDFVIFATIQTTDHDIKVVGRRSAGIVSGASLKGKRVGYVGGTFGEIFLNRYLEKHGMDRSLISLTSAGPAQLRDLFLSRSLDAIIIWEPVIQDILADSATDRDDVFLDVDRSIYTGRINLVARPQVLRDKQEEARRLVRAMIEAESIIKEHPEEVRQQLELWLDRKPGTLAEVFDQQTFRVQLDVAGIVRDLRMEAEWAQEAIFHGKAKMPEDFSRFVDPTIMEAVAPDRVRK
jgi:NitT/TauT family transport system substrate-binding protein